MFEFLDSLGFGGDRLGMLPFVSIEFDKAIELLATILAFSLQLLFTFFLSEQQVS